MDTLSPFGTILVMGSMVAIAIVSFFLGRDVGRGHSVTPTPTTLKEGVLYSVGSMFTCSCGDGVLLADVFSDGESRSQPWIVDFTGFKGADKLRPHKSKFKVIYPADGSQPFLASFVKA